MQFFNQSLTIFAEIQTVDIANTCFEVKLRSGDFFTVNMMSETYFEVLKNLDGLNNDRVPDPENYSYNSIEKRMEKYLRVGDKVYIQGLYLENGEKKNVDASRVVLMHYKRNKFIFETNTHWWLTQIRSMADAWIGKLFGDNRDYNASDFSSLYRTNLNLYGGETDDNTQVMATLSRLIYGLSSAYLLLGDDRFLKAAAAGVKFQRTAFRSIDHEGSTIIWSHARKPGVKGATTIIPSQNPDDYGAIPLYEQIYALAGMTQYFRITGEGEVLEDIQRTVKSFNRFFLDEKNVKEDFPGYGGYFSHVDPVTMRPDSDSLGPRKLRKNWNSIGDHIPAYLVNIILALDPLPVHCGDDINKFLKTCNELLDRTTDLIIEKFPDPDCPYVNERFHADWSVDHEWGWQQNRAIVGHNLKIAWNLTRVASYYKAKGREDDAARAMAVAERLGDAMVEAGLDLSRGGCYDAVERHPTNGQPVQCVWGNHKDFWQQEQGILAYLILYGYTRKEKYLDISRDLCAWWNTFHLDYDNQSVFFRVLDNGAPMIQGRGMAGYDIAGYHSFELNFLAHVYMRSYVDADPDYNADFCMYFRPDEKGEMDSLNVCPDFITPGTLKITGIKVDGKTRQFVADKNFQIPIESGERGKEFIVQFTNMNK